MIRLEAATTTAWLPWLVASLAAVTAAVVLSRQNRRNHRLSLPPGPPQDPVLGNERQRPSSHAWRTYAAWQEMYGDVIYLRYGAQRLVVLNSVEAAVELLDRRSAVYSSRPPATMAHTLATRGLSVSMTPASSSLFRKHRRAFQAAFGSAQIGRYHDRIAVEIWTLLRDLLRQPTAFDAHYKRFAASIVFSTVYGVRVRSHNDPVIAAIAEANRNFLHAFRPEGYAVDRYPALRYLPRFVSPWRRLADRWFAHEFGIYRRYYDKVRFCKDVPPCIAADVIAHRAESGLTHDEATFTLGSMIAAGSDSTAMTLSCLTMAAALHPTAVARAQREIDEIVGHDDGALPCFSHIEHLSYCRAFVQEVLRWRPFAPGGTPHYSMRDDEYRGWRIPKGTTVMANLWAIHNDTRLWGEDALAFRPERHLDDENASTATNTQWPSSRRVFTFGFGRRICPGRQLAMLDVHMAAVMLLWAFRFAEATNDDGKPVAIDADAFTDGLASHPLPFECVMTPRSKRVVEAIEAQCTEWDEG